MHTARLLTVYPSMHYTGRVSAPGGGCLVPVGGVCSRGEGAWSRWGVSALEGVSAMGGLLLGGGIPACTEADPPLWTEFLTHTTENITLPQ